MPSCAAIAPIAQHRGGDAQLASDLDQRPTAARQQGNRLPLELIRKMTPFLAHSTPFRSRRSLAKVSTNAGEAQYWLATLPPDMPFDRLVDLAKLRWRIERDYQELKQELGLGHYEGRGWRGFHHHATLCIAAYAFLIAER